ncbi:MAG TPA: lysophospholipid acyltransferase family protein [Rhodoblastus sp.]|nr:lysophospholipid acyltransferase family protein [Rhodoblastus sp.]
MAAIRLISLGFLIVLAAALGLPLWIAPARVARPAARILRRNLCRAACRALGIAIEFEGSFPSGAPVLLVANHISWTDVLALGSLSPILFVARHDLANWPVLGALARAYDTLFVDRGRKRLIPQVNRQIAEKLEASEIVALFPEATTGDGTRLKKFHSSHLAAARDLLKRRDDIQAVLVTPASIAYTRRTGLPLGKNGRAAVAWYGDTDFVPHLLDLARSGPTHCRIRFLAPIRFDRGTDRKTATRDAAEAIRIAFLGQVMEVAPETAAAYVLSRGQVV